MLSHYSEIEMPDRFLCPSTTSEATAMSNTMIVMLLGAGVGGGVLLIIRAIQPRPTPLLVTLRAVRQPGRGLGVEVPHAEG